MIAGDWKHPMYELAWANSFEKNNYTVIKFSWNNSFKNIFNRLQVKYSIPFYTLISVNLRLIKTVKKENPCILIIWIGTQIFPISLKKIKQINKNIQIISYVHDDPFAHIYNKSYKSFYKYFWKNYLRGIQNYDLNLYSKKLNVIESYNFGSKKSNIFRQYFVPEIHKIIPLTENEKLIYNCEVTFAGHYENDGRLEVIKFLVDNGIIFNLYGDSSWSFIDFSTWPKNFRKFNRISGIEYSKALNGAVISLCFMSKLNRDQYTTRCFEIPACGSILMSEKTNELCELFNEGEEAYFFQNKEELLEKVKLVLGSNKIKSKIVTNAQLRLLKNNDDIDSKIKNLLTIINTNTK